MNEDCKMLSVDEHARACQMTSIQQKNRFLLGRRFLRILLSIYLNVVPADIVFECNQNGKPTLKAGGNRLHFNMSHSQGLALIAICREHFIGVDIEALHKLEDLADIAGRFFTKQEVAALKDCLPSERVSLFFRYWTGKEAYIKACGGRISDSSLKKINLAFSNPLGRSCRIKSGLRLRWLSPAPKVVAAIAHSASCSNFIFHRWDEPRNRTLK